MRKSRSLTMFALLALAACNMQLPREPETRWGKDGATQQDLETASYACEKDARALSPTFKGPLAGSELQDFFNRCMRAQGWRLEYRYE